MVITAQEVSEGAERLTYGMQVRFTPRQYELLREIAEGTDAKLATLVRNIVVVWAMNHRQEQDPEDPSVLDVAGMVAELNAIEA